MAHRMKKREVLGPFRTPNRNLLHYDDVDGRRFLVTALARMNHRQRLTFVNWCCRQQDRFPTLVARATWSERNRVFYPINAAMDDLAQLTILGGTGGVEADVILTELERRARRL